MADVQTKPQYDRGNQYDLLSPFQRDLTLYQQLLAIQLQLNPIAIEVAENMMPTRPRFLQQANDRTNDRGPHNDLIFDSTATLAIRTAQAGLLAGVTSPASPWVTLGVDDDSIAEIPAVKFYLDFVNKKILRTYDRSNFYREMALHYLDVLCLPSAVTLIEPDDEFKIRFTTLSWGTYVLGVDKNGDVDTIGREEEYTIRQLVPKFCKMNDDGEYDISNLTLQSQNLWKQGIMGQNSKVIVVHMIKPNPEYDPSKPQSEYKKWSSRYFEKINLAAGAIPPAGKFLRESGFDYFPGMVSRWSTRSQEIYANDCPGFQVLGDIKQLYKNTEDQNHSIDLINDPPLTGPDAFNDDIIQKGPGGFTPDNSQNKDAGLRPLFEIGQDLRWVNAKIKDLQEIINRGFFVDIIQAASRLRDQVTVQVTATEIQALKDEGLVEFGPVTQSFFRTLRHCIDVTFFILNDTAELPPPPPQLQGHEIPPEFISPFARAQKVALLTPLEKVLSIVEQIYQAGYQKILYKVDFEQIVEQIGKILNLPPGVIRPDDVATAMAQADQKAAQAQQRAQQQPQQVAQAAKAAKDASQTPTDNNSLLSQLLAMSQAGGLTPQQGAPSGN